MKAEKIEFKPAIEAITNGVYNYYDPFTGSMYGVPSHSASNSYVPMVCINGTWHHILRAIFWTMDELEIIRQNIGGKK